MNDDRAATLESTRRNDEGLGQSAPQEAGNWEEHARWLAASIKAGRPRAEMDQYMSRAQLLLKMHSSMDFRKIVDRAIETLNAPDEPATHLVQHLNPTTA